MLRQFLLLVLLVNFFNCKENTSKPKEDKPLSADAIVEKAIAVAGGKLIDHSVIAFDFRDIHFKAIRNNGKFELIREFKDSLTGLSDILSNSGFERLKNGEKVKLKDSLVKKYSNSVNSVHYFSVLPYGLDGKAVHKNYLGTVTIKDKNYHKIKVTFSEDGGGEDYDDTFLYWINTESFTVDYIAYTYKEKDGQGFRFREAFNVRTIDGIRFADYDNYKNAVPNIQFEEMDTLFSNGKLELLSKIELKNIKVKILD